MTSAVVFHSGCEFEYFKALRPETKVELPEKKKTSSSTGATAGSQDAAGAGSQRSFGEQR